MTSETAPSGEAEGLPFRQRRLAMGALMVATVMAVLDASITNVALPRIAEQLRVDAGDVIWVANAYQLATAACIVALAGLSDMVGYRRVFLWGLGIFTVASLACALSPTLFWLVAARVVQGLGAAALMAVSPALSRLIYPSRMLGRALALSALTVAASATCGPMVGGGILAILPWPWLFALNVPLGVLGFMAGRRNLPRQIGRGERFDLGGAILAAVAMGCFVIALDGLSKNYPSAVIGLLWGISGVAAIFFLQWQRVSYHPLLPPHLFRSARFSLAAATSACSFVGQGLAFVTLPFLFQGDYGYSPFASGLLFTPWPLTIVVVAPIAGRLADRMNPAIVSTVGLAVLAVGLASLAALGPQATLTEIIWRASLSGLGFGLFQSPNNRELLGNAPRNLTGAASGVLASARTFGQSLGAAIAAVVVAAGSDSGAGAAANFFVPIGRIQLSLWLASAAATVAFVVSVSRLKAEPLRTPPREAQLPTKGKTDLP